MKNAFVPWEYHRRPHHICRTLSKIQIPKTSNTQVSKSKTLGSKMEFSTNFTVERLIFLWCYHLRPHHLCRTPSKIQIPKTSNTQVSKSNPWGLKWNSSTTSLLKGAFVPWENRLRPHHVCRTPSKIQIPKTSNIQVSKSNPWGLKWNSSTTSLLKGAFVPWENHLRPHHVCRTPSKIQIPKTSNTQVSKSKALGSKMEFITNFTVERCICSMGKPS